MIPPATGQTLAPPSAPGCRGGPADARWPMTSTRSELRTIPGIGPSLGADLEELGVRRISDLVGRDPEDLYRRHSEIAGGPVDRCVLYAFRCAVYFASEPEPEPELLKWWNWKDRPFPLE